MKNSVKKVIGKIASGTLGRKILRNYFIDHNNILYCHYVGDQKPYLKSFNINYKLECFEKDINNLKQIFKFVPLKTILDFNLSKQNVYQPLIALTFDDGLNIIKEGILQVLDYHKINATMFVMTSCIDNKNLMWRHKLAVIEEFCKTNIYISNYNELALKYDLPLVNKAEQFMPVAMKWPLSKKEQIADEIWKKCKMQPVEGYLKKFNPYLSWDELKIWIKKGHSVGLHTHTHVPCSKLDREGIKREVIIPAELLKNKLGLDSLPFSYPFGDRFENKIEWELYRKGIFNCMLGIEGFSEKGTVPYRLERVSLEGDMKYNVFGRIIINKIMNK